MHFFEYNGFQYPVLNRRREKFAFAILILIYGKVVWQKFIFHFPDLIPSTKNEVFRLGLNCLNSKMRSNLN